jgi:hypothetical protein
LALILAARFVDAAWIALPDMVEPTQSQGPNAPTRTSDGGLPCNWSVDEYRAGRTRHESA